VEQLKNQNEGALIATETINSNKPSISLSELNSYIEIRAKMEGQQSNTNERPRIGFKNK
jgi:transitional endoplasmic reticulum ATPase